MAVRPVRTTILTPIENMANKFKVAQLNITFTPDGWWHLIVSSDRQTEETHDFEDVVALNAKLGEYMLEWEWEGRGFPHAYWEELQKRSSNSER